MPNARVSTESLASLEVHWATILHDIGKPDTFKDAPDRIRFDGHATRSAEIARAILTRLKFPRRMIDHIDWLVTHHMMMVQLTDMTQHKRLQWFHHPLFLELMEVFRADACGTQPTDLTLYEKILTLYRSDLRDMPHPPEPLLSGHEIMEITGLTPGPHIGELLTQLHEKQLAKEITTREQAIESIKRH